MKVDLSMEALEAVGRIRTRLLGVNPYVDKRLNRIISSALVAFEEDADSKSLEALADKLFTTACRRRAMIQRLRSADLDDEAVKLLERSMQKIKGVAKANAKISDDAATQKSDQEIAKK